MERFADELDLAQFRTEQVTELAIEAVRSRADSGVGRQSCLDCGGAILAKRLALIPNAIRCAPCQERHEGDCTSPLAG